MKIIANLFWYRKGEGVIVRLCIFVGAAIIWLMLASMIDSFVPSKSFLRLYDPLREGTGLDVTRPLFVIPTVEFRVYPITIICAVIFLALCGLTLIFLNRPLLGNFLIETEEELRKVAWPTSTELLGSMITVLIIIICLACILTLMDYGLSSILYFIKIGY